MTDVLTWMGGVALGALSLYIFLYFLARRRSTPDWAIDCDELPEPGEIMSMLTGLTNGRHYAGNQVEVLINGAIFDPMLNDIANAEETVHLETFVWWSGKLEQQFADALIAAARRGVDVRLMVDGVGSLKRSSGIFDKMRDGGVTINIYSPVSLLSLHRFNERTHRKLLIVDGTVGYTMGHGISDYWMGDADGPENYRDTGVRLVGPVVHGLQSNFAHSWIAETGELLCGNRVFPDLKPCGDVSMSVVSSSAGDDYSYVDLAFSLAVAAARKEVLIQNPYFAPDPNLVTLLCDAVARGVRVSLMLPGSKNDSNLLRRAAQHLYPRLIKAGVELLEFTPTLSHQKVLIVDGILSRVGSTNLDSRSLELNEEAGVVMLDPDIAGQLRQQFDNDRSRCRRILPKHIDGYSLRGKAFSAMAYMIRGQL